MNWQENWWKFLVLALVVLGLVWWRQSKNEPEEMISEEAQIEEQVNRFLEERGIELPEGGLRANLKDMMGGMATGAASKRDEGGKSTVTVIAALPDLDEGFYMVWARNEEGEVKNLGRMRIAKGGYLLEVDNGQDLSGYKWVVVSKETEQTEKPSEVVLEGEFEE